MYIFINISFWLTILFILEIINVIFFSKCHFYEKKENILALKRGVKLLDNKNLEIIKIVSEELSKTKSDDVEIIDVKGKSTITDFFVVATGTSRIHLNLLANTVKEEFKKFDILPLRREGIVDETNWIIIDYGFVIFHLMTSE